MQTKVHAAVPPSTGHYEPMFTNILVLEIRLFLKNIRFLCKKNLRIVKKNLNERLTHDTLQTILGNLLCIF